MLPETLMDVMTLNAGHSLMISHTRGNTTEISNTHFEGKKETDLEKFGLFGGGNNYNTFDSKTTPKDFNPEQEEYIEPMFRLLSNCIVAKSSMPTEFPEDVLKASMPLLVGCTINCDHETDIANAIGSVKEVTWQDSYRIGNKVIPGGINGVFKIDAKANPRIARGINMDPPSIHSNSVTVKFEWKPSHKFEKPYEFYENLGKTHKDGTMVRRIATKIVAYMETSLVWQGADPFAKMIKDGKIINSTYASSVYGSFSEKSPQEQAEELRKRMVSYDFKTDTMYNSENIYLHNTSEINNVGEDINPNQNSLKTNNMNKELAMFLEQLAGCLTLAESQELTAEVALSQVKAMLAEKQELTEKVTSSEATITELREEVDKLKASLKTNEKMAEIGTSHLSEVREATVASYNKLMGDKSDEAILSLINADSTNLETLLSLKKSYDSQLEEKFPLHCSKCNSTDLTRATSVKEEDSVDDKGEDKLSETCVYDDIRNIAKDKLRK